MATRKKTMKEELERVEVLITASNFYFGTSMYSKQHLEVIVKYRYSIT